jgi:hypothetical protein
MFLALGLVGGGVIWLLERRLSGSHMQSRCCCEDKNIFPLLRTKLIVWLSRL